MLKNLSAIYTLETSVSEQDLQDISINQPKIPNKILNLPCKHCRWMLKDYFILQGVTDWLVRNPLLMDFVVGMLTRNLWHSQFLALPSCLPKCWLAKLAYLSAWDFILRWLHILFFQKILQFHSIFAFDMPVNSNKKYLMFFNSAVLVMTRIIKALFNCENL